MNLSPIFPPDIKPVHVGVYRTAVNKQDDMEYNYWDGAKWSWPCYTVDSAFENRNLHALFNKRFWCGLSEKPK